MIGKIDDLIELKQIVEFEDEKCIPLLSGFKQLRERNHFWKSLQNLRKNDSSTRTKCQTFQFDASSTFVKRSDLC